jgi:3-phenylpropionate/cinnamic acid dioxygenase small subunit
LAKTPSIEPEPIEPEPTAPAPKKHESCEASRADARTEIENLMYRYAEAIDGGDFEAIGELFAKGRMLGPDGEVSGEGKEQVIAIYDSATQVYEDGTPKTQHVTTNLHIEFAADGRSAQVRSRFTVVQGLPDFPLQPIITGHYSDQFAFTEEDGWHFTQRHMRPVLLGDLSRHLKYELAKD